MKYLLDTHILLWSMAGDKRVDKKTRDILDDFRNNFFISNASLWEITIKESIGKLKLAGTLAEIKEFLIEKGIRIIDFDFDDLETLRTLPFHHQDPFDRLIIAQAKTRKLEVITNDSNMKKYFI
jgi:PIN domain nuclease of toxin-antitoxin system